jgi:hypothetical protein
MLSGNQLLSSSVTWWDLPDDVLRACAQPSLRAMAKYHGQRRDISTLTRATTLA